MPTAITDYHETIRDAVKDTIDGLALGVTVVALDDIDDIAHQSVPCIAVVCVGPEQDRPEMSTNSSDGIAYATAVLYIQGGVTSGEKTPSVISITNFRRRVRIAFNNKRLSGVAQIGWCEVSDSGPLVDERSPAFQKISTGLVVNAVGRFPRS